MKSGQTTVCVVANLLMGWENNLLEEKTKMNLPTTKISTEKIRNSWNVSGEHENNSKMLSEDNNGLCD